MTEGAGRGDRSADGGGRTDGAASLRSQLVTGIVVLLVVSLVTITAVVGLWIRFLGTSPELLVFLSLTLLTDVGVIFLFANQVLDRSVLRPVESMVDGAERVATGEHEHRLEEVGASELRRLARTVNRMADHLIQQQEELAHNVASLHETNRELRRAQRELVRAEKLASAGRLAAGIAHEVGNPLGSIIGYAEVLRRRHPGAEEWADEVEKEARRIDRIVKSLLEYARPAEDEQRHPIDLSVSVSDALDLLRAQGRLGGVEVAVEIGDDVPEVRAKAAELEQVLVNLLLNALDAIEEAPRGEGRIAVDAVARPAIPRYLSPRYSLAPPRRESDPEGVDFRHLRDEDLPRPAEPEERAGAAADRWVELTVRDSGPGFPEEDPEQVFDPFFTTKEPGKGTGLGLFVSSQIVRRLGGRLEVRNHADGGGAVTMWLPAQTTEENR